MTLYSPGSVGTSVEYASSASENSLYKYSGSPELVVLDAVGLGSEPYSILLLILIVQLPSALFTVSFAVASPDFIVSVSSVLTVIV